MSDIIIEGSIAKFSVNEIGKKSGETFMGEFEVKCFLSPIDVLKSDKLYRELLGEVNPHLASTEVQNVCFALSQLKYRVLKSPAGWKNNEIDGGHIDANIVVHVLNKAIDAELQFKNKGKEKLKNLQTKLTKQIAEGEISETTEDLEESEDV